MDVRTYGSHQTFHSAIARCLIPLALASFMSACGAVKTQRDFQTVLTEIAKEENTRRYADPEPFGPLEQRLILQKYHELVVGIDSLDGDEVAALKANKLYANTLTLKAIALWRLKNYDAVEQIRTEALSNSPDPRDNLFLLALPGLVANDQAAALINAETPKTIPEKISRYDAIESLVWSGRDAFEDSLSRMKSSKFAGEELETYFLISSLAGYTNLKNGYSDLIDETSFGVATTCTPRAVKADLENLRCDVHWKLKRLEEIIADSGIEDPDAEFAKWQNSTGITSLPPGCVKEVDVAKERETTCP
ncbi:hypothetical protein NUH88_12990 [Nisaea acidiphila]|uniref:Lipoprotein n=1 Tax=Nisaea acidiphila TaxID=1862145 RepID=A0A9J7AP10_9PROT|nr:hypothetical protein [Nisaea acidiphila]UUX48329.1 hypothetical protein NUH88_12990 [Nisaea acidiphila]